MCLGLRVFWLLVCELECNNVNIISLCEILYMQLTLRWPRSELSP